MRHPAPDFAAMQKALAKAGLAEPVLLLDRPRLDRNIQELKRLLPRGMGFRIVAKSLPCGPLLQRIASRAKTDRLMSFNCEMAAQMLQLMPTADQLMGKPVPVAAAASFFDTLSAAAGKRAAQRIQWLVDTPQRVAQFAELADKLRLNLRVSLEIDVGLHRGGMVAGEELQQALALVQASDRLALSGLMGYEPHLSKIPKLAGWRRRAQLGAVSQYRAARAQIGQHYSAQDVAAMVFNTAGSPTFGLYKNTAHANEISAGSALVKPSDFDLPILSAFQSAAFIATPALKVSQGIRLPALEYASNLLGKPQSGSTVFIHGGYWMANPVYPKGLKNSSVFGRSSNQEMLAGPARLNLDIDDFVFLRPTQSEAVFLQFPKIAVFDGRRICDLWHPLPVSA